MIANKTKIIRIGNSQGVRIPRHLLEQAGLVAVEGGNALGREVELQVGAEGILIRPLRKARAGWAEQFAAMTKSGDDVLLDAGAQSSVWDEQEWVWQ